MADLAGVITIECMSNERLLVNGTIPPLRIIRGTVCGVANHSRSELIYTQDSKLAFIRFHCTLADISREPMRNQKWTKSKLR
ncbi:hypothetical protein ALC62_10644 [Cyphomyrmex costatus]|uniref:Uncharacterized protein n=1 Tax=Cyphomyrmex costatus TaxID=456900 RepID=A0A195CEM6_9HYME|nr:hypothetical protein ALC62_10644 [Cyphomyrmex costatus]